MRKFLTLIALTTACASSTPPACPKCYAIDEVVPYEPPQRMVILCDQPDAAEPAEPETPTEDPPDGGKRTIY